ncbi:MAG: 5-methyltetrahydropteroyltriglutamate--homocysteine methyltransferase [Massilia sp.]
MIPTEPIGSIPRPPALMAAFAADGMPAEAREAAYRDAVRDTVRAMEATGSPVITDGEQGKYPSFWSYCLDGAANTVPEGFDIPYAAGHSRRLPRLTRGPFRYQRYADSYLRVAQGYARAAAVKQAIISPSALSMLYPADPLPDYARDQFIDDLLAEHDTEIRRCLDAGAASVQVDFVEGRLAMQLDPSGELLNSFIDLNNMVLGRYGAAERARLGVHTCPGSSYRAHGPAFDYADLLPSLFELEAGNFYIALAGEAEPERVLKIVGQYVKPHQRVFIGVTAPSAAAVETPELVRDRVLRAARFIRPEQLGTTDDCGFAPCSSDHSASRAGAFAKIRARVEGTALAAAILNGGAR